MYFFITQRDLKAVALIYQIFEINKNGKIGYESKINHEHPDSYFDDLGIESVPLDINIYMADIARHLKQAMPKERNGWNPLDFIVSRAQSVGLAHEQAPRAITFIDPRGWEKLAWIDLRVIS